MKRSNVDLFVILKDNFINIPIKSVTQTYHINTFLSVRYLKLPSAVIFAIFRSTLREGVKVKIWKLSLLRFIMKVRATIHFPLKVKILLLDLSVLRAPTRPYSLYFDSFPDSPPEIQLHVVEFLVHWLSWSPLQLLLGVVNDVGVLLQSLRGPEIQS